MHLQPRQPEASWIRYVEGMSMDPDKVSALNDTTALSNPTEVRSLLGMANYCSHFIPNYTTITEPMREIMKKDTEWQWEKAQEDAFNLLMRSLREDNLTQYYDPKKTTKIIVYASPVGLRAILVQDTKDERVVISYASHALRIDNSGWSVNSSTLFDVAGMRWYQRKYHVLYIIRQPTINSIN